jgi:LAO/AO transport system kinase
MTPFYVYMLRCGDGSYYTGQTDDMDLCLQQHDTGKIGYTATRKPVELIWQGEFETREGAIAFEQQIKGWSRAKKEALIQGDWARVKVLAKSKTTNRSELTVAGIPSTSSGRTDSVMRAQNPNLPVRSDQNPPVRQDQNLPVRPDRNLPVRPDRNLPVRPDGNSAVRPELVEGSLPTSALNLSPSTSSGRTVSVEQVLGVDKPELQRRAIAKAITLLESTREDHRTQADELLTALLPHTGKALRLGISGVPGVGKSTFIEVLGLNLIARGHRVAVLTIDPSSTVSGGSILGDKTRMEQLSVHERAYIRPSPSSGTLGGVAEKTREAMLVCEAAGYDVVIVETVGVGQSETAVANMTDMFVLMQLPNAGDDLQAIKKGVMELADLVIINKADIDADAAMRAQAQITSAMRLFGLVNNAMGKAQAEVYDQHWHPQVLQLSALHNQGVDAFWTAVSRFRALQTANGPLAQRRQQQSLAWMWERIEAGLKTAFRQDPTVASLLPALAAQVASGQLPASSAARQLLAAHNKHVQRT